MPVPLPHHRTYRPASGGSSSHRIETLPGRDQGLQAEAVPVGVGQGHLEDLGTRNPPVSLAATTLFAGVALRDTAYPQVMLFGGGGLPFLQRTRHKRRRSHPSRSRNTLTRSASRKYPHPAGDELVRLANAELHRHAPQSPPCQDPQLALQPLDRLRGDQDLTGGPSKQNPEPRQRRVCGVPDRGLLPVHLHLKKPADRDLSCIGLLESADDVLIRIANPRRLAGLRGFSTACTSSPNTSRVILVRRGT